MYFCVRFHDANDDDDANTAGTLRVFVYVNYLKPVYSF